MKKILISTRYYYELISGSKKTIEAICFVFGLAFILVLLITM